MEQRIILSGKLKEFADRRAAILLKKDECVKKQRYEEAAKIRDEERRLEEEVLEFLKKDVQYKLTDYHNMIRDIWMLFELVKPGELTFKNALKRINVENLERMNLVKKIEEYRTGKITLDAVHNEIKKSFNSIKNDLKEKIVKLD